MKRRHCAFILGEFYVYFYHESLVSFTISLTCPMMKNKREYIYNLSSQSYYTKWWTQSLSHKDSCPKEIWYRKEKKKYKETQKFHNKQMGFTHLVSLHIITSKKVHIITSLQLFKSLSILVQCLNLISTKNCWSRMLVHVHNM